MSPVSGTLIPSDYMQRYVILESWRIVQSGWSITNSSSSGTPYTTPAGHTPAWSTRISWHKASAFEPTSYSELISNSTAVVHTLGILLEDTGYKSSVRGGDVLGVGKALLGGLGILGDGEGNPLKKGKEGGYERINRDSGGSSSLRYGTGYMVQPH